MAPTQDLRPVAKAGRELKQHFDAQVSSLFDAENAGTEFLLGLGLALGHGGAFDYQRTGSYMLGYKQRHQFWDVSNFNVGLFCQQAGLSLDMALQITGQYARRLPSNFRPDQPFGLDPRVRSFIELGFSAGASGQFD